MKKNWMDINCLSCKHNKGIHGTRMGDTYKVSVRCWNPMMKEIEKVEKEEIVRPFMLFTWIEEERRCIDGYWHEARRGYDAELPFLNGYRWCYPEPIEFPDEEVDNNEL